MSNSPVLDIFSVTVATIQSNSISLPITIEIRENETVETLGLIDSGAGGQFIDQEYVEEMKLKTSLLEKPLLARNVDGKKKQTRKNHFVCGIETQH